MMAGRGRVPGAALGLWLLVLLADAAAHGATALVALCGTVVVAVAVVVAAARHRGALRPARADAARVGRFGGSRPIR